MDSLIATAARALAEGDALAALKHVSLRDDPPGLALRGIAMAQLGEHARARELLRRAARSFGPREVLARARCVVAEAEVALAVRDLGGSPQALESAAKALTARADHANAAQARLIAVRRLLLLGRLDDAGSALAKLSGQSLTPALLAVAEMASAELALRSLHTADAAAALDRAATAAQRARVPALLAEINTARSALEQPSARSLSNGTEKILRLHEVEALFGSDALVIDACRRGIGTREHWQPLARRPVLFALLRGLATAWPGDASRNSLITEAFRAKRPDETHRARLRVEIGRLRKLVSTVATIEATAEGFVLKPKAAREVVLLLPPIEGAEASLLALLADGEAWPTSALAMALDESQRNVQRALVELERTGRVRSVGRARAQRWLAPPLAGFATNLLLPVVV